MSSINRADQRRQSYQQFRSLGYTPKQSYQLRDRSLKRQNASIGATKGALQRKSAPTQADTTRLELLRRHTLTQRPASQARGLAVPDSRPQRYRQFGIWSGKKQFPAQYARSIQRYNQDQGFDPNDSFGFRVFYHKFVDRWPEADAYRYAETHDT